MGPCRRKIGLNAYLIFVSWPLPRQMNGPKALKVVARIPATVNTRSNIAMTLDLPESARLSRHLPPSVYRSAHHVFSRCRQGAPVPPSLGRVTPASPASLSSLGAKDLGQSVSDPIGAVDLKGHISAPGHCPPSPAGCRRSSSFHTPWNWMTEGSRAWSGTSWLSVKSGQLALPSNGFPTKGRLAAGLFQILLSRVPDV